MLTESFVESVYRSELSQRIKDARNMRDMLVRNVDGTGLQEYLARINNYENEAQFEARQKHAISNKFITEELLRPVDNAFHARGGSKNYQFSAKGKDEELIKQLVNVKSNLSLSEYIEQEWFHRFITDPNGLIFMEISDMDEDGEEQEIKPTYKSIYSIRDYEQNGIFVDWVIFEPHVVIPNEADPKDEEKKRERFWVVDKSFYYLYESSSDGISLVGEPIVNSFERVPAILCSNIVDNVTGWKKSAIDAQVELLDKYVVSNSVLSIAEFMHNYPREWAYVDVCGRCDGDGEIDSGLNNAQSRGETSTCPSCGGTGKDARKDPTDRIDLRIPEKDGVKIDPPSGFTSLPIEPWKMMVDSVDRWWDLIYFSQWGTSVSKDTKNETATGRFIDAQPVNNRLNKYSKSIELAHTEIANFIGEFNFPETFERAVIQYGRRYMIETPDQIWDKYIKAKKDNAPIATLDLLLSQYLESEFRENERRFIFEVKKTKLEPFVHWDVLTVQKLNVAPIDYAKKLYFSEWFDSKDQKFIIDTDFNKLDTELTGFAQGKVDSQNKKDGNE